MTVARVPPDPPPLDASTALRKVFSAFPSGIAALCARCDGEPVGMVISTFTPISLDPPLLSVCIQQTSNTWPRLRQASALGVSILGQHHERAGRQLALKVGDRFAGLRTTTTSSGAMFLQESCAWFDCTLDAEYAAGDHLIAVLRIDRSGLSELVAPLVFHASRFRRLAEA